MSFGSRPRRQSTGAMSRFSLLAALTVVVMLVFGSVPVAVAQDASPAATPTVGECNAPEVPEGTPEPFDESMVEASPEAMEGMDVASPEPSGQEGTPVAEEPSQPTGEVVEDEALAEEVSAGLLNVFACLGEGNYLGAAALMTEDFRLAEFGTANLYSVAAILEEFPQDFEIGEIYEVQDLGDGRFGVEYDQIFGKQVARFFSVLVEDEGFYMLDQDFELTPETTENSVTIGLQAATDESEFAYQIGTATVQQQPATLVRFFNVGEMEHEAVFFKTPEDFDPATLLQVEDEADIPEGVEFVGAAFAPPGEEQTILLQDLEVGTYTIYCFIPAPDGEPHAAKGMITQLTVTEPVELDVPDITGGTPEATPDS